MNQMQNVLSKSLTRCQEGQKPTGAEIYHMQTSRRYAAQELRGRETTWDTLPPATTLCWPFHKNGKKCIHDVSHAVTVIWETIKPQAWAAVAKIQLMCNTNAEDIQSSNRTSRQSFAGKWCTSPYNRVQHNWSCSSSKASKWTSSFAAFMTDPGNR